MKYVAESDAETRAVAKEFAKKLKPGDVVCMTGELGAGKTTFTKGIAETFNSLYEPVSPTFNIVNEYPGDINIFHFDLYRLETTNDLYSVDFDSYLYSGGVCVIEWPEIAYELLDKYYSVNITYSDKGRNIEITDNF